MDLDELGHLRLGLLVLPRIQRQVRTPKVARRACQPRLEQSVPLSRPHPRLGRITGAGGGERRLELASDCGGAAAHAVGTQGAVQHVGAIAAVQMAEHLPRRAYG
eukprot:scaffold3627_cov124-Isochrysis_galbana.AAC.7